MTFSSEPRRPPRARAGRVRRGVAVQEARPAALHVDPDASPVAPRRRPPVDRVESARKEGYDDGFKAGLEAAKTDSDEAHRETLRKAAEALHLAASAIEAGRTNAIAVVEEDAATLAVELAHALVDHELSLGDRDASAAIRRALRLTVPGEDLVVRLHPDEVIDPAELQPHVTDCQVTVLADPAVERGGCVIDAGPCRIDAQIEPALARVRWALLASNKSAEGSESAEPPPVALDEHARSLW